MSKKMFRGIRIDNGEEVKGGYIKYRGDHFIFPTKVKTFIGGFCKVHPSSLAMATGKLDSSDKMIYGSIEIDGEMSKGGDRATIFFGDLPSTLSATAEIIWLSSQYKFAAKGILKDSDLGPWSLGSNRFEIIGSQWEGE